MHAKEAITWSVDELNVRLYPDPQTLGRGAAAQVASTLRGVVRKKDRANLVLATGNSQLEFLGALRTMDSVPWNAIRVFHLDEYANLSAEQPASFRRFLQQHIIDQVKPLEFHEIIGDAADLPAECRRYETLLNDHPPDLVCLGIGENGHLAFNEPSDTNFEDTRLVRIIRLDEKSRNQQVGEGHFADISAVPTHAITLSVAAILKAEQVSCVAPEKRKAEAVRRALQEPISEACPASILRTHRQAVLYLDQDSSALLGHTL